MQIGLTHTWFGILWGRPKSHHFEWEQQSPENHEIYRLSSHSQNNFPFNRRPSLSLLTHSSALALIFASQFPRKSPGKYEVERRIEQLRMPGLPDYLLNNLTSVSLNSCLALIFATKFYIVAEVFGNIKNWFSAKNCVFMAGLLVV